MEEKFVELLNSDSDNSITIGEHTLFIDKVEEDTEPMTINVHGKELPVMIEGEVHNKYTLYIGNFNGDKLHKIIHKLREAGEDDEIEIRISSDGGDIDSMLTLINTIQEKFAHIVTVIECQAYSAGALLFTIGHTRIVHSNASLLFHTYSTGFGGQGNNLREYIQYTDKHLNNLFYDMIVKNDFISKKEFDDMSKGSDWWMDSVEMSDRGIATHVLYKNALMDIDAYLQWSKYKGNKTFMEWLEMKIKQMDKDEI